MIVRAQRLAPAPLPPIVRDPDILAAYAEDASGEDPGWALGVVRPETEGEAAAFLRESLVAGTRILPQAARSSLTGGAIPHGEVVLSVERLRGSGPIVRDLEGGRGRFGAGLRLAEIQAELASRGLYYPPVPTYQEAMLGGTVSTNAGGAASFKYGATRRWIRGLRVLLYNGDLLSFERGEVVARRGESFDVRLADGARLSVPCPIHHLPDLPKLSAGYHAADALDLVDLLVGSEGTLGLVTEATLDLAARPAAVLAGLVFLDQEGLALDLAGELRNAAVGARARRDPRGPDVRSIEWLDARCLALLRDHGDTRRLALPLPAEARVGILFEMELRESVDRDEAVELLSGVLEGRGVADGPLSRLAVLLHAHGVLARAELAFPGDDRRQAQLVDLREAVPRRVGELLSIRRGTDAGVGKVGGDFIVPFPELPGMMRSYAESFSRRGLDFAVWGHLADGNLHPNALPRNGAETAAGREVLLELAEEVARRGGAPLSEHGVGRSPIKQELLRRFLGAPAVERMREIKRALDPPGRFAPGVLFPLF